MASKKSAQRTHAGISESLVGKAESIDSGKSAVASLVTTREMAADNKGLVHGGFTFGLADYAAMLAVNDPFVVLLASNARFTKPVAVGDRLTAQAKVTDAADNRKTVRCEVTNQNGTKVFEGEFLCMVLERHVLDR
jgi:uncharacterized protein (TIGR00369 family)